MNNEQKILREQSSYLKSVYEYSNYDDYIIISEENNIYRFLDMGGVLHKNLWRERTNYDRTFYSKKVFSKRALKKKLENDYLIYRPGFLYNDSSFIDCPLDFGSFLLLEITENIATNSVQEPRICLEIKTYNQRKFDEFRVSILNRDMNETIKTLEAELPWYEDQIEQTKIYISGKKGVFFAQNGLIIIRDFLAKGYDIKQLTQTITPFETDVANKIPKRVFDFVEEIEFRTWSKITNRVGKDNYLESGTIIEKFPKDKYLISLIEKNSSFRIDDDERLKSYDGGGSAYIKSEPYEESGLFKNDDLKNQILSNLIREYDFYDDYLSNLS